MICSRCGHLLVEDRFIEWTARWRCLKCGHVHDSASVKSYLASQKKHLLSDPQFDYFGFRRSHGGMG
jgi:uncharacterized Zn finger protein